MTTGFTGTAMAVDVALQLVVSVAGKWLMAKQIVTRINDEALCDALQRYAAQHTEGNESQVVRLALRNLLMGDVIPERFNSTSAARPGLSIVPPEFESTSEPKIARTGMGSVQTFLKTYGEANSKDLFGSWQ